MDKESAQGKKGDNTDSIVSRLYLADASVVPRKDDIKPLSALAACAPLDKNSQIKANNSKSLNVPAAGTETIKISSPSSTGKVSNPSVMNKEASSRRENRISQPSQNQNNQSAGDIKQDKRKWALEILARKNASSIASKDETGDTDALKGNFPLLAQLPADMRPQLAPGRNNKVPVSVRQAQLHRIAEHYLQKASLDVICRCADTELAMADAVNVEKDICERSNSKSIYVNLCSQATRQPAKAKSDNDTSTLTEKTELGSDLISQQVTSEDTNVSGVEEDLNRAVVSDQKSDDDIAPEQTVHKHTVSFHSAEEALKKAGLFDSPPNSPERNTTTGEGECSLRCTVDLDSEPSKSVQSSPNFRAKDASSLKDDKLSVPNDSDAANCQNLHTVMSCQQPETNSEVQQKLKDSGETKDVPANGTNAVNLAEADRCRVQCEKSSGPGKEIVIDSNMPDKGAGHVENSSGMQKAASSLPNQSPHGNALPREGEVISKPKNLEPCKEKSSRDNPTLNDKHLKGDKPPHTTEGGGDSKKRAPDQANKNTSDSSSSIYKKVEMFVKGHIRPLCKSGVITVDQYRWAVAKTTDKVMNFHRDAKNANFLIKEGDKVKKLALQYVEAAQQKIN
uniref:RNA exonuclease 1 homolog-like domain-containing protein n=1 Tax=Arundo donax TaxID=35708 RepID=A0A0A9BQY2_ARUDO